MRYVLARLLACSVVAALAALPGCADNPGGGPDGSVGMDGRIPPGGDGGEIPTGGPCGTAGGGCCNPGRICELGLDCGRGDVCCIASGSGASCSAASDCCRGLACQTGRCCAPRTATCTGSSDCCEGLLCSGGVCAAADDVDPMPDTCGRPGQRCCDGFTCRDEGVCVEGTCTGCGGEGDRCCDGASPCTSRSLACDVTTATCVNADPATACGEIDNACCAGLDGALTDCSGTLVCRGGTCLRPDDTGFMGAPCGARGTCDPGLVCDRRMDPSGLCATPPDDCGRDGMMCCDLGGSEGACEGSYHCQFGDCTDCRGPSLTCLLGGLLPGQECCSGSVCRPAPLIPRCCMGQGGDCENSLDCCGLMFCGGDGTCTCGSDGSFCIDSSECCEGSTCQTFQCRPSEMMTMCKEERAACMGSSECCAGLSCSETRTEPTAPPVRQCCAGGSTSCEENEDCCGRMLCQDGECQCIGRDGLCDRDIECCDGDICLAGSCQDGTGCMRETQTCDPTADECCGALRCARSLSAGTHSCCVDRGVRCRTAADCCGRMQCDMTTETCQAVAEGGTCDSNNDCEDGVSCSESMVGAGDWQCRRPTP
ncbi:MAG: hypothetical protein H6719_03770 [Sandaracinaceae bacterium]|nr:hypothetical protein [Sandaracinaceae bacterium]